MEYGTAHTTSTNTTGYSSMSRRIEPTTPSIETGMEKHWAAFSSNSSLPHKSTSLFKQLFKARELCESRGGRPGLPVPDSSKGLCGRIATMNLKLLYTRSPAHLWHRCDWVFSQRQWPIFLLLIVLWLVDDALVRMSSGSCPFRLFAERWHTRRDRLMRLAKKHCLTKCPSMP